MSHPNRLTSVDILARLKRCWWLGLACLATAMPPEVLVQATGHLRHVDNNFASVPTTVKTFANDSVMLPCKHKTPHQFIRWIREGDLLLDSREPDLLPPARFAVDASGNLRVHDVQKTDTGEYVCEVMTPHGLATQVHAIEVQSAPTVVSVPSGVVELNIGGVFEIVCEPRGVPYPIITWRHQGRTDHQLPLGNNTRRLHVAVRDRQMAGRIECVATNGVGEATAGVDLLVLFSPEIQASTSVVHSKIAERAYLECEVIAQPAASVHWFHHGMPVVLDQRIIRQDSDLTFNQTTWHTRSKHVLIIRKVRETDLGMYECRAENKLGFSSAQMDLTGRPLPAVFKTSPTVSTPLTHNLIWQTESLSPIIEYMMRFRQVPTGNVTPNSRQYQVHLLANDWKELVIPAPEANGPVHTIGYTLRGLMPATLYEVTVTARNRYGMSDVSRMIRFATGGEIELPNYSTEQMDDYTTVDSMEVASTTGIAESELAPDTASIFTYPTAPSSASRWSLSSMLSISCFSLVRVLRV